MTTTEPEPKGSSTKGLGARREDADVVSRREFLRSVGRWGAVALLGTIGVSLSRHSDLKSEEDTRLDTCQKCPLANRCPIIREKTATSSKNKNK